MSKIEIVDYGEMPRQASQMRSLGQELNGKLVQVYEAINNMRDGVWYGERYDSLVGEFNKIIPEINQLLTLVVGEIPFALETIANNYAQADRGTNVTSAQNTAPKKIQEMTLTKTGSKFKFISASVESVQNQVESDLAEASEKMNEIEGVYGQIQWQSEASEAFKTTFTRLKGEIITSFENIKSQFTKLMTQTQEDVQAAESSNTVG